MVFKSFNTEILDELCSKDQLELLDLVDRLRSQGIDNYVSLPQIIVCGDQSSGKSSVLEAISGVSFPVKSNLCTRFPTELVLRKATKISVGVSIVPHPSHDEPECISLSAFREKLDSFSDLPNLIEKAKEAMAISTLGRAFSKDLLRIEVSGPDRPHLTIVDLPGLIHSENKQQSASDIELVQDVVQSYMKEPRSIILAVVSAKNDYANQIVLKLARAADRSGNRTLGVVTKPDTLVAGSHSEDTFISLAQNMDVEFRLGWHVLRNMDSEAGQFSLDQRNIQESSFFSQGRWKMLPSSILGIKTLRERLSEILLAQIATELPSLVNEIEVNLSNCNDQIRKLGEPRVTTEEQRMYLLHLTESYQSLVKAAVDGSYNNPFFGDATSEHGYKIRIRAVVQNRSKSFADLMTCEGHLRQIGESASEGKAAATNAITTTDFLGHVGCLIQRTKGRELPGSYNPMVVANLFEEQSRPWEAISRKHIRNIADDVKDFLYLLITHIADETTLAPLFRTTIEPSLSSLTSQLEEKLSELLAGHQKGHPITYNESFLIRAHEIRKERIENEIKSIIKTSLNISNLSPRSYCEVSDFTPLLTSFVDYTSQCMRRSASSDALDQMSAYYEIAKNRFVDDVAVEVVESIMMSRLQSILSPTTVARMSSDTLAKISGESAQSRERRSQLTAQRDTLTLGIETCKRILTASFMADQTPFVSLGQGTCSKPDSKSDLASSPRSPIPSLTGTSQSTEILDEGYIPNKTENAEDEAAKLVDASYPISKKDLKKKKKKLR